MPNHDYFKPAFLELATDGCIGDLNGEPAYAYIRVSDEVQAEEGRSGLPRQIEHVHEVAKEKGYKIPWDMVFADDGTGFEFETRPQLSRLRREYKSAHRRASVVVMEHLDRLSRHADWHQGFLLEEMANHDVLAVFWKPFGSRIERAVMGAIAQDGMEAEKERMREGTLKKARSGRITARVAAFGYKFVDQQGQESTKDARKNTYYAIDDHRKEAVKFIFEAIAYGGMSTHELCKVLDERARMDDRFSTPRGARAWNEKSLVLMLRNPVYKGEFIAHRHTKEQVKSVDEFGVQSVVWKFKQRPEEEWIRVPVPPIVEAETWELANRNLYRNKNFAKRNKKNEYLLSGLIRCATCGRRYSGMTESKGKKISRYFCFSVFCRPAMREQRPCDQRSIHCSVLDIAVWDAITVTLLDPDVLEQAIDARYSNEQVDDLRQQITFLEREIASKTDEERKLYKAYLAGAFSAEEYAAERKRMIQSRDVLLSEMQRLQGQVFTEEEIEERKALTRELVQYARELVNVHDVPFELKQKIVRLLVDNIVLNTHEGWFEMTGVIGTRLYQFTKKNYQKSLSSEHIRGQEHAKRALEIAAGGNHNIRLIGPPGTGKTLLARSIPGILPRMTFEEALEVTRIYSVADMLTTDHPLMQHRPFRAPHYTISQPGIVGGGTLPRPGEVTLAHRGVLFLDECTELNPRTLEVLRQPIEDKIVTISRARGTLTFPANFLLVLAHNPCPCGYYGDPTKACTCTPTMITRYQSKLSGPLLDRIDIHVEVPRVDYDKLMGSNESERSETIRGRIEAARQRQRERFKGLDGLFANADMQVGEIDRFCTLSHDARQLLEISVRRMGLSARSYHRTLKLARTIADLADADTIETAHVAEAIQYRPRQMM